MKWNKTVCPEVIALSLTDIYRQNNWRHKPKTKTGLLNLVTQQFGLGYTSKNIQACFLITVDWTEAISGKDWFTPSQILDKCEV
jgi:hypothetical protein